MSRGIRRISRTIGGIAIALMAMVTAMSSCDSATSKPNTTKRTSAPRRTTTRRVRSTPITPVRTTSVPPTSMFNKPTNRSVGIIWPSYTATGYTSPAVPTQLDEFQRLGLNRISFVVTWYQQGVHDFWFGPSDDTPTDDSLRAVIRMARARNMEVVLKPHIDLPDDRYRGEIKPSEPDRWFARYSEFTTHYADLAAQEGVHTYVVGTELAGTSSDQRWAAVVATARSKFGGQIVYGANWDEANQVAFWNRVDEIGIDAYYPLAPSGGTTDTRQLTTGWDQPKRDLVALAAKYNKPLRFTEVGYTRHRGTTHQPYDFRLTTPAATDEQRAAFEALFAVWLPQPTWAGADIWSANPPDEDTDPLGYSPFGQPAQDVIAAGAAAIRTP
jgi:hypothetical protein